MTTAIAATMTPRNLSPSEALRRNERAVGLLSAAAGDPKGEVVSIKGHVADQLCAMGLLRFVRVQPCPETMSGRVNLFTITGAGRRALAEVAL